MLSEQGSCRDLVLLLPSLDSGSYFWPWKEAVPVILFANFLKGTKESKWRLPGKRCFFPKVSH